MKCLLRDIFTNVTYVRFKYFIFKYKKCIIETTIGIK